jgi:hypothetical protein
MIAEITIQQETIVAIGSLLIMILGYLWGFARLIAKLELKPSEDQVKKLIDDKFENHCPFAESIDALNKKVEAIDKWKDDRIELLHRVEKDLQQVRINTEMICENLKIAYKK